MSIEEEKLSRASDDYNIVQKRDRSSLAAINIMHIMPEIRKFDDEYAEEDRKSLESPTASNSP